MPPMDGSTASHVVRKARGAIDLVKAVKAIGFQQAVEFLSEVKVDSPQQKRPVTGHLNASDGQDQESGNSDGLKPFVGSYHNYAVSCPWLDTRIPDAGTRGKYGVFCYNNPARKSAWSGRVMIPIKDQEGVLYGYLGRYIGGSHHDGSDAPSK